MVRKWNIRSLENIYHKKGFLLVQSEVYIKTVSSRKSANRQITKMRHCVPTTGRVLVYKITENQFHSIQYLVGSL